MAALKSTRSRRDTVLELASIAVEARRTGDRPHWLEACTMWQRYATTAEQRRAPAAITKPWPEGGR